MNTPLDIQQNQNDPRDHFEIVFETPNYFVSSFDGSDVDFPSDHAGHLIEVMQGDNYLRNKMVTSSAIEGDGRLIGELDTGRGSNVEYLAGWRANSDGTFNGPLASLRVFRGALESLPSYSKLLPVMDSDVTEELQEMSVVAEPVSLCKAMGGFSSSAAVSLVYATGVRRSGSKGEKWFAGIVRDTHEGLVKSFGPNNIRQVGEAIPFIHPGVSEGIELVPTIIDTVNFSNNLAQYSEDLMSAGDTRRALRVAKSIDLFDWSSDLSLSEEE